MTSSPGNDVEVLSSMFALEYHNDSRQKLRNWLNLWLVRIMPRILLVASFFPDSTRCKVHFYYRMPVRMQPVDLSWKIGHESVKKVSPFSRSYCCTHVQSAVGIVYLSVCNAVHYGAQGWCRGWKLYRPVPSKALPVNFFRVRHFCCWMLLRMYHLATKQSDRLKSWQAPIADFRHQKHTSVWNYR